MFRHVKTGTRMPVFCPDHFCHADMRAGKGWVAVSAGDFNAETGKTSGYSQSLKMGPAGCDAQICNCVVTGMESIIHLVQPQRTSMKPNKQL